MADKVFVPPIKIQGKKTKLVPLIKQNVLLTESNAVWIEPFMGSGVVGFNIEPHNAIFADINPHIIRFYNEIKSGKITSLKVRKFLEREGKLLEKGDDEHYYLVRNRFNKEHDSLDFLFLNRSCFNGMIRFNKDYEFNVPYGHKQKRFSKSYITKIVNQVEHVSILIKKYSWNFYCKSFSDTISMANENDFIYCDPPYIGRHVDYYDSWNEQLEISLHKSLVDSKAKFMLSTWDHNQYRKNIYINTIWNECTKITQNHFYHVGAKESNRNTITEALLTNYNLVNQQKIQSVSVSQISLLDKL